MRFWKPKTVEGAPRVGIGVASFLNGDTRRQAALRSLVASFQAQTWDNWKMLIYHDGPLDRNIRLEWDQQVKDNRVDLIETAERKQKFGHPHRQKAVDTLCATCQWVMLTNDDNWYAPVFLEWLLAAGTKKGAKFVYCDMVHSHKLWKYLPTQPRYRHLDLGGFLVHSSLAKKHPFDKTAFNADGDWINRLAVAAGSRIEKVPHVLFVHN